MSHKLGHTLLNLRCSRSYIVNMDLKMFFSIQIQTNTDYSSVVVTTYHTNSKYGHGHKNKICFYVIFSHIGLHLRLLFNFSHFNSYGEKNIMIYQQTDLNQNSKSNIVQIHEG